MFFEADTTMHIVDTATKSLTNTFLDKNGTTYEQIVERILPWSLLCVEYSSRLRTDQGLVLTSDCREMLEKLTKIQHGLPCIEKHSSLSIGVQ